MAEKTNAEVIAGDMNQSEHSLQNKSNNIESKLFFQVNPNFHSREIVDLDHIEDTKAGLMLNHLNQFTSQIRNAWRLGEDTPLWSNQSLLSLNRVVICGMGGSGVGADLIEKYAVKHGTVPICAIHGYDLPPDLDEHSLVLLVSYSGDTVEILSCYEEAKQENAICAVVSSGGQLLQLAAAENDVTVKIPADLLPREALAYLTVPSMLILARLGVLILPGGQLLHILEAVNDVIFCCNQFVPKQENQAKQLATVINCKTPLILGVEGYMEAVAYRWQTMLNENAKLPVLSGSLPEFFHNGTEALKPSQCLIVLRTMAESPKLKKQITALQEIAGELHIYCENVWLMGKNSLAKAFSMMLLGDYVSLYAAALSGTACDQIPLVTKLKTLV